MCVRPLHPREARGENAPGSRVVVEFARLYAAIDASTPRITPRFLNVHLLFLLRAGRLSRPSSTSASFTTGTTTTSPSRAASFRFVSFRFVSSSVSASVRPFPYSMERRGAPRRVALSILPAGWLTVRERNVPDASGQLPVTASWNATRFNHRDMIYLAKFQTDETASFTSHSA